MSGAKVAKLVEREIDIANRTLETLESSALKAVEETESLEGNLKEMKESLESLEKELEDMGAEIENGIKNADKEISSSAKEREKFLGKLPDGLFRLYKRVQTRYPAGAVSLAIEGACNTCHRALPLQTYNQIMAGNDMMQCPSCARILVYRESAS